MREFDKCDFLYDRWKNLILWRNLWTILLFVLGSALLICIIGVIFSLVAGSEGTTLVSSLGIVFDGIAVAWIVSRRNQAVAEETEAKADLLGHCGPPVSGSESASPQAGARTANVGERRVTETMLQAEQDRLKLFRLFR